MTTQKQLSPELSEFDADFKSLIESGFVAVNQLNETSALACFQAAQTLRPYSTAPKLGLGFIALNKLDLDTAENYFKDVLDQDPSHELARVFLGIALAFSDDTRQQGIQMINNIAAHTVDTEVAHLANTAIEWTKKEQFNKEGYIV